MNFDLSEEQVMLQEAVKQYLQNECPLDRLREIFDGETGHDPVLWKGLVEILRYGNHHRAALWRGITSRARQGRHHIRRLRTTEND